MHWLSQAGHKFIELTAQQALRMGAKTVIYVWGVGGGTLIYLCLNVVSYTYSSLFVNSLSQKLEV